MFLVVGLGNPGRDYEDTRHNVGFFACEELARRAGVQTSDKKFKAQVGRGKLAGSDVLFMKPQTYMNLSGESVGPALGFYKLGTDGVIVLHDDLDLDLGRLKLKKGGGHGGHNGLRSLLAHLPDDGFARVRMGIGRPPPRWDPADYVLSKFSSGEWPEVEKMVTEAADAVEAIIRSGLSKTMTLYNRTPARPDEPSEKKGSGPRAKGADETAREKP